MLCLQLVLGRSPVIRPTRRRSMKVTKEKVMKVRNVLASFAIVALLASASLAQHVKTDFDHNANFSQYKTYSWEAVKTHNELNIDRIKNAVNADLTAKGWTQLSSGGSLSLVAMEATKNQQTLNTVY